MFPYRVSNQSSTDESSFTLLYGLEARFPSNLDLVWINYVIDLQKACKEAKRLINDRAANKLIFKVGYQVRVFMPAVAIGLKQKLRNDR